MPRGERLVVVPRPCHPAARPHAASARLSLSRRVGVRLVPALTEEGSREVLRRLRVDWPSGSGGSALPDTVLALQQALGRSPCATACEQGPGTAALPEDVICKVHLKSFVEQQGLVGYDPNLDVLLGEPHVYSSSSVTVGGGGGANGCKQACFLFSPIVFRENKGGLDPNCLLLLQLFSLVVVRNTDSLGQTR